MQIKSEVFSRFGSSVDFFSGEPLGGVETPTVWSCVKSLSATEGGSQRILHLSVFISRAKLLYICLVFSNLAV